MSEAAKNILKTRLASGEISIEEYRQLLAALSGESEPHIKERSSDQGDIGLLEERPLAEFEDLKVFETCVFYKGCKHALSDVTSVRGAQSASLFNFVPTEKSSCVVMAFVSGETVNISEDRILFGGKRHEAIGRMLNLLRQVTFNHRLTNLTGMTCRKQNNLSEA